MTFEILERKVVFQGRAFDAHKLLVRLPDGRQGEYDLVSHRPAVTLVPVDQRGNIWFVRQFRLGAMQTLIELPAGVIEDGEAAEACAAREIREEIGMAASDLRSLGQFYMTPGYCSEYMHVFLATGLYPAPLKGDTDEFLNIVVIPIKEVLQMALTNQIQDGKTLAALLLAQPYL
jgi:ADP-ribose pyrophosphatase